MSLFDVETTAEALQEDEELIEAVENLVETAAISVKTEIMMEVNNAWQTVVGWIEWMFPMWVLYRSDHSLLWEDLQKLAISGVLVTISCLLLAPFSPKRAELNRRRRQALLMGDTRSSFRFFSTSSLKRRHTSAAGMDELVHVKSRPLLSLSAGCHRQRGDRRQTTSLLTGRVIRFEEEEETDRERFAKNYHSLLMSRYRKLLLPPECKLVDKPKRPPLPPPTKQPLKPSKKKKKSRRKKRERDNFEDHPAKRLQLYAQNLWFLIKSLLSYDYVGAGMALIRWLEATIRIRALRRKGADLPEDDDDDDDESKASASVASASTANRPQPAPLPRSSSIPRTPDRLSIHTLDGSFASHADAVGEEKKESPIHSPALMTFGEPPPPHNKEGAFAAAYSMLRHRTSESSLYSTPVVTHEVVGDCDEISTLRLPLPLNQGAVKGKTAALRPSIGGGGKKRDMLANYRSSTSSSSVLAPTSRNAQSLTSSTTSTTISLTSSVNNKTLGHTTSFGDITTIHRNGIKNENDENETPNIRNENDCELKQDSKEESEGSMDDSSGHDDPVRRVQRIDSDFSGYFFEAANTQDALHRMAIEAPLPDKNGYIVGDEFLPGSDCTPLLVFVNSRSGPQQGQLLITQLRRLLNPIQVWDLGEDGGPETALESFCKFRNLRILVCGGDGTVSWIIAALEKMKLKRKWPPIGILPLGTGNDLARIHGWGGGYNNESLIGILEQVADSYISLLDQWELTIESRKGKVKEVKQFFNYLGVGADAQAALQVHMLRESKPQLFFSRVVNKFWYGLFGAEDIIKATSLNLPNEITLIADGVEVPLPPDSQGIILLNIDSYAGGAPFWATGTKNSGGLHRSRHTSSADRSATPGDRRSFEHGHLRRARSLENLRGSRSNHVDRIDSVEDLTQLLTGEQLHERVTACDMPSSCQDGFLDIVSVRGSFHLGQIRVGLSNAQRLCQCREATIHLRRKVAVQIDGEPWRQNTCTLKVTRKPERAIMLHRSEDKNGVETEVASLLDWAEKRQLINGDVHYAMMKEFSRRIEHKTRQRRNREDQDNIMYSLKRAIGSTGAISSGYDSVYEYHS